MSYTAARESGRAGEGERAKKIYRFYNMVNFLPHFNLTLNDYAKIVCSNALPECNSIEKNGKISKPLNRKNIENRFFTIWKNVG